MQRTSLLFGADYAGGVFAQAQLDYAQYVSAYAHPALVPARNVSTWTAETGAQAASATQPAATGLPTITFSNTQGAGAPQWQTVDIFGYTVQAGDALTFTTTALQVQIRFTGALAPDEGATVDSGDIVAGIRNGAVASVGVDGNSALTYTYDTFNGEPLTTLYLDGTPHTIQIIHTGGYNPGVQGAVLSPVTALVGASVASQLVTNTLSHPTLVNASWRVVATDGSHYSVYKTPFGGTETLVASGLAAGAHYSGAAYVPGVDLYMGTNALTPNDSATFATDVTMVAIESISFGTGAASGGSSYTTPIYDFMDPATQPLTVEWVESAPPASLVVRTGNTPTPDTSWATATAPLGDTAAYDPANPSGILTDGNRYGSAGLMATPPGRYLQLTVMFVGASPSPLWMRDFQIYTWAPPRDSVAVRIPLGMDVAMGPLMQAYVGALSSWLVDVRKDALALRAAGSVGGATDQYLAGYLADLGLAQVTGEQPLTAQARARGVLTNAAGALSLVSITQQVAALVTGVVGPLILSGAAGSQSVLCNGVTVAQGTNRSYTVTVPPSPYVGLPGLPIGDAATPGTARNIIASHITATLRPVTSTPNIIFS